MAAEYRPAPGPEPSDSVIALADLACVQAVSAAADRLAAAAESMAACVTELRAVDHDLGRQLCRWSR